MAGVSLTACVTPKYSVRSGSGAGPIAQGQATRPPANPGAHGTMAPYQVGGIWYVPREQPDYDQTGIASWYGEQFNLKATADGEVFDLSQFSAAHTTLPLPSMVEVTNLDNGRKLVVRVNDRGPFVGGRLIDLSQAAARELGYERAGTAHVRVRYVGPAPLAGPDAGVRYAKTSPAPAYPMNRRAETVAVSAPMNAHRPADEEIFADAAGPLALLPETTPRPLVPPPTPVSVSSLKSLPDVAPSGVGRAALTPAAAALRDQVTPTPAVSASNLYRIQAGAFGDQENARKAAAQLASMGVATIEPFQRGGATLYRVTLPGPADEAEAYGVRDKVAAIGFAGALVLRPMAGLQ
ncbi:MAG: septal ring lytic transglycosylase RlpA family protein [Proteobacteria bacterium]|nr:septal ring lytic transglycosylase RlpA family protein [Pseudomonadota bacterium]